MKLCVAKNCRSTLQNTGPWSAVSENFRNISFFRFPLRDKERTKAWVSALKLENFFPSLSSRLCSKHFPEDAFIIGKDNRRYLTKDSIPSIFDFPLHIQEAATDSKRGRRKRYFMEIEEDEIGERKVNISPPIQSNDKFTDNIQTKSEHEPCSSGFCSHYITFIEEKARNHQLNRKVEELEERILCLEELLVTQNIPVTYIKQELVEEDEVENKINDSI